MIIILLALIGLLKANDDVYNLNYMGENIDKTGSNLMDQHQGVNPFISFASSLFSDNEHSNFIRKPEHVEESNLKNNLAASKKSKLKDEYEENSEKTSSGMNAKSTAEEEESE